ncbi:MAG: M1 family metallopeptidase [Mucilaginibacter polytrichastri]|nr:M1 family metallopeptidase [Mucilaginibacter polytrichastri]
MKILGSLLCAVLFSPCIFAQQLYMPRNIQQAYAAGTRSMDGKPGKHYWQNHGVYDMQLSVDAKTKTVSGSEDIVYENNSPDSLKNLVIRFVNNLHKPESPRGHSVSADFLSAGLTITAFTVDGEKYPVDARSWGTVGTVNLKKIIAPKSKANLHIEWNYPLSKESGREGQIDSTTFYVAYSYPRVSVYDDYNGWDRTEHTDRQEFYNDFNDYTFSVKAPKDYVVWATGDFHNPDEVLQPEIAARLKKSYTADEVMHIATTEEMRSGKVTRPNAWNTWKFSVKNISDVCFGLSNHYAWDASSTIVDRKTNRRASTQAAFDGREPSSFTNSVKYANYALSWFSENWPGVPYPFSKMTAFEGFADMEYPMMVNDSKMDASPQGDGFGRFVQDHEIAHTWFPFYMGINETRYAAMDEGWATTLEYLIALSYNKEHAAENYKGFRVSRWISDPSAEEDQPIISMSTQLSGSGYGNNAYGKPSLSYLALKDMLGDALFKKALHTYVDNWHGKHPVPWDYFNSMNAGSGQNLNWFFHNWFFTNNYIDLVAAKPLKSATGHTLMVKNTGGFAVPFDVIVTTTDGKTQTFHQTPAVWKANQKSATIKLPVKTAVKSVKLDGGIFMDATPADNTWTAGS